MNIGPMEIVIVLVLALLVFGPKRLPQAGRSLGRAVREFKKATDVARSELGLDEVTKGIREVKGGISDIKSSATIDLKLADAKPTASKTAPDPSAAATVAAPAAAAAAPDT
ncbi:MAG: twin-arginine translocase TatA/TatE family subunit, partial [Thermoleophilia bacterium]